ncbi:Adenylate kinase isoenzyme 5 [Varanus komodoensis]|nr:Adenylate kinase isoenzyme 5 [Varanus komodoensis]
MVTFCFRSVNHALIHRTVLWCIPKLLSFSTRISWGTLSKALLKSREICTPDLVVFLSCSNQRLKERLMKRADQQGRPDDNLKATQRRLTNFKQNAVPLVKYFQERGLIMTFDADGDEEEVFRDISIAVDNKIFPIQESKAVQPPDVSSVPSNGPLLDEFQLLRPEDVDKPLGEVIWRFGLRIQQYADDTQLYLSFTSHPGPCKVDHHLIVDPGDISDTEFDFEDQKVMGHYFENFAEAEGDYLLSISYVHLGGSQSKN